MKNKLKKSLIYAFLMLFAAANTYAEKSLDAPVLNEPEFVFVNEFRATWDEVSGAAYYRIWVTDNPGFASFLPLYNGRVVTSTNVWVFNLDPGHEYEYWIRAYNQDDEPSDLSNLITVETNNPNIPPPDLNPITNITGYGFDLSWTEVAGGNVGYQILISKDNFETLETFYEGLYRFGTSSHTVTSLDPLTEYSIRIKAKDFDGVNESTLTSSQTVTTIFPAPVAYEAAFIGADHFTANWSSVTNAISYDLYIIDSDSEPVPGFYGVETSDTSMIITGLDPESVYYYDVGALADGETSPLSNQVMVTTMPENTPNPPVALEATKVSALWFVINWEEVEDVDHYKIYISVDDFSSHLEDFDGMVTYGDHNPFDYLNYFFDESSPATDYQYRITSVANGLESSFSNTINVTTTPMPSIPVTPLALSAENVTEQGFVAIWEEPDYGIFYRLDISSDEFDTHNTIPVWWDSTHNVEGLESGTDYEYRVRACNDSGCSDYSNIIEVTTLSVNPPDAPTALDATGITQTGFVANWSAVSDADGYLLFVSEDYFNTHLDGYNGRDVLGLSHNISGLEPGNNYQYRLRAYSSDGQSGFSNIIEVTTTQDETHINNLSKKDILVYPNPAKNYINIIGLTNNSSFEIFSITGAKIKYVEDQSEITTIDVSSLENGVYILKISSDNGVINRRIFINK